MHRRDFLKILLASAIAESVDVEKLLWVPKPIITVPELPISLYGIPYHESNGSTGKWLGFERAWLHPAQHNAYKEIANIIVKLEENKK